MSWLKFFSSVLNTFVKHTHILKQGKIKWAQDKTDPQGVGRTETISVVTFECQYRNILESLNLSQNITKPTRVTHTLWNPWLTTSSLTIPWELLTPTYFQLHLWVIMTLFTWLSTYELQDMHPVINTYAMRNSLTCYCLNKISCLCLWMSSMD